MRSNGRFIGVCLSTVQHEDRFYFIRELNRAAVAQGYRLIVFNACTDLYERNNLNNDGESAVFRLIPYDLLDAMIVFPYFLYNHPVLDLVIDECRRRKLPLISIDAEIPGCTTFSFSYANVFEQLCSHVIEEHGARDLRMIAGIRGNDFSEQRVGAFRAALEAHRIPFDESLVAYGNFWETPTQEEMVRWFETEQQPFPDAIICANDIMAITASSYLQAHGCRVPEDCIVTGFDGIMQANYHIPNLTTCRQKYDEMADRLLEAIGRLRRGEAVPLKNTVDFRIIRSQSCGCCPVSFDRFNGMMQDIFDRMKQSAERQRLMCAVQSAVSKMNHISELPARLIEKFIFPTQIFALNDDLFSPPDFGASHRGANAFSEEMTVLYHRYHWWDNDSCTMRLTDLVPNLTALLEPELPVIVCVSHFIDLVLGYCVFQCDVDFDEYEKIHTFMNALNASLGAFHGQVQIKAINTRLQTVNEELEKLYVHDYLTGLFNRRGFYREFSVLQRESADRDVLAFLVSADLDGLKDINDTYGHLEGDNAIVTVAHALQKCAKNGEICARFGGDEFAVGGVIGTDAAESYFDAFRVRLEDYLKRYNQISGNPYPVEASIGFYAEPLTADFDLDRMIKNADAQMYADKTERKRLKSKAEETEDNA